MSFPLTGFPNKEKRRLLYLAGTVPVHYEGDDVCSVSLLSVVFVYLQGDRKVSHTPVCFQLTARLTPALVVFLSTRESVAVELTSCPAAGHRE